MKFIVFTDVHGNLEAFRRVLDDMAHVAADHIISLGDNIGYGPDPEAVMELMIRHRITSVLGNHELAVRDEGFIQWFNPQAQKALRYTIDRLSATSVAEIHKYPKSKVIDHIRFVHGTPPSSVALYLYQLTTAKLKARLDQMPESICFSGHTHDLGLVEYDGDSLVRFPLQAGLIRLKPDRKYIVSTGSVGQPRDGDYRAKYVIFDSQSHELEVRFIDYDYRATVQKIMAAGIPAAYAKRLEPLTSS